MVGVAGFYLGLNPRLKSLLPPPHIWGWVPMGDLGEFLPHWSCIATVGCYTKMLLEGWLVGILFVF